MKRILTLAVTIMMVFGISGFANATLMSRASGTMVYDSDLDITWLADAKLAATNTFGVSGIYGGGSMYWTTANTWIGAMNTNNYLGYNDWRLPTTLQPDPGCDSQSGGTSFGSNCTGSEMGHLYYVEGVSTTTPGLFENTTGYYTWSGTEWADDPNSAWSFSFGSGSQFMNSKGNAFYAWAVRDGDVGAPIPEPGTIFLLGSGLAGMALYRRRKVKA